MKNISNATDPTSVVTNSILQSHLTSRPSIDHGDRNIQPVTGFARFRGKLKQFAHYKNMSTNASPAFHADCWDVAPKKICIALKAEKEKPKISPVQLSKIKALDWERKNLGRFAQPGNTEERIFKELPPTKDAYYNEMIVTTLQTAGMGAEKTLKSFEHISTAAQHRHTATLTTAVKTLVGVVRQFVPSLPAKVALSIVELTMEFVSGKEIIGSGDKRLWTSGLEEIGPLVKFDETPYGKNQHTMFGVANEVNRKLGNANKVVQKVLAAKADVESALRRLNGEATADDEARASGTPLEDLAKALEAFEPVRAEHLYHAQIKANYKTVANTAKKEFYGNKMFTITGLTGSTTTMGTGLFAIMSGTVVSSALSGGIGAVGLGIFVAAYCAYHFSDWPDEDGKRKAERQILSIAKSVDLLCEDVNPFDKKRAEAHRVYLAVKKTDPKAKEQHLALLAQISRDDKAAIESGVAPVGLSARGNWERYRYFTKALDAASVDFAPDAADLIESTRKQITAAYEKEIAPSFNTKIISAAAKPAIAMRMASAERILLGQIAHTAKRLISIRKMIAQNKYSISLRSRRAREAERLTQRKIIQDAVFDLINLKVGLHRLNQALDKKYAPGDMTRETDIDAAIGRACFALGACKNPDVHALFIGDAQAQVNSTHIAKALTQGESERYYYTNWGSAAYGILSNLAFTLGDVVVNGEKLTNIYHGPKVIDEKFLKAPQGPINYGSYALAAARAGLVQQIVKPYVQELRATEQANAELVKKAQSFGIALEDSGRDSFYPDNNDPDDAAAVDAFIDALEKADIVPPAFTLLKKPGARQIDVADEVPAFPNGADAVKTDQIEKDIVVKLDTTQAFHESIYATLDFLQKLRFDVKRGGWVLYYGVSGFASPLAQPFTRINLGRTRDSMEHMATLRSEIRTLLASAYDAHDNANQAQINTMKPPPKNGGAHKIAGPSRIIQAPPNNIIKRGMHKGLKRIAPLLHLPAPASIKPGKLRITWPNNPDDVKELPFRDTTLSTLLKRGKQT